MKTQKSWAPGANIKVSGVELGTDRWVVEAETQGQPTCPGCQTLSASRHSTYLRCLQDLPVQGVPVMIRLRSRRWRCRNPACVRKIFTERLPGVASPLARRSSRVIELVRLIGHSAGGRPGERLMERFAMPASDDTILRHLKQGAKERPVAPPLRAVGIDNWAWRKGQNYGTIIVDLERRTVADLLEDRCATSAAMWLAEHPTIEIVSRDRCGLYATAAGSGAPQARQAADRFHLIQNLREAIEKQLGGLSRPIRIAADPAEPAKRNEDMPPEAPEQQPPAVTARLAARNAVFVKVRALYGAGNTAADIVRELGLSRKRVDKWIRLQNLPARNPMAPKPCSPAFYKSYLVSRWTEGYQSGRGLFEEIKCLGYTGCFSYLARFLSPWRDARKSSIGPVESPNEVTTPAIFTSGQTTSPLVAAALCIKPRPLLTARQAEEVDALKRDSPDFAAMRSLAMKFRGILRGSSIEKLDRWTDSAKQSGIYSMKRFAKQICRDIDAVRVAVTETWSNGQTEGQINRLKTLKRSMYGRAGVDLLRARMLPLSMIKLHQE